MNTLLKYEFRKTWAAKLMVMGLAAVAEIAFLIGIAIGVREDAGMPLLSISMVLLPIIAVFGVMFIGIQSVVTLHRDMNTKQGYMLYMTPRSSYQMLGAKFLENGLSLVLASAAFFLLAMLDVTLLFSRVGQLEELWSMIRDFLRMLNAEIELNTRNFLVLAVTMLSSWLAMVAMAYLADIVSSALLNGKKYNGILSFLLFVALTVIMNWLQHLAAGTGMEIQRIMLIRAAVALAYSVVMYFLSAWVMDRYLSV